MTRKSLFLLPACALSLIGSLVAQSPAPAERPPPAPATLPGNGLAGHDFFYAGEAKDRRAFIVKGGKVVWSYDDPSGRGEISDAALLSNGNVLLAHQFAVALISPEKKVLWRYEVPPGAEVHTAIPIGQTRILFLQNGDPALLKVVNIVTNETEKEMPFPVGKARSVHGQLRHARLTPAGTLLVAHMDMGKVCEYDANLKELWSFPATGPWGATPLKNGNVLIVDRPGIREVTRRGDVVWSFNKDELPGYTLTNLQLAWRLPNSNTLLNNWKNEWQKNSDPHNLAVQAIELTPDKKVVWALRSWDEPNLGPATTIQILDEPDALEDVHFGDIK